MSAAICYMAGSTKIPRSLRHENTIKQSQWINRWYFIMRNTSKRLRVSVDPVLKSPATLWTLSNRADDDSILKLERNLAVS